jgi:hypothetical protein
MRTISWTTTMMTTTTLGTMTGKTLDRTSTFKLHCSCRFSHCKIGTTSACNVTTTV